jgi:adenosylcobinamide-phosphate synthase
MVAEPALILALALDAAIGWPDRLYRRVGHPVGVFASIIGACETRWNNPEGADGQRRIAGIIVVALLIAVAGGGGLLAQQAMTCWLGSYAWIGIGLLAFPGLAQRSLYDHVRKVADTLQQSDLAGARSAVAMIVGRDTQELDESGVARAAIESLSESFCDGVTAPLFWFVLLGLPGIWIYKAINTADSMIGHREEPYRAFGWAAARADDALNFIPARIAGCLLCIAGRGGWGTMWQDARKHASPNAGWPEAAMAGALGLWLAGPVAYDGVTHHKPWIGNGRPSATGEDIRRALSLYVYACAGLWLFAGGTAWL